MIIKLTLPQAFLPAVYILMGGGFGVVWIQQVPFASLIAFFLSIAKSLNQPGLLKLPNQNQIVKLSALTFFHGKSVVLHLPPK